MPIYEYQCENEQCGLVEDHVNAYKDRDAEYDCPSCGQTMRRRPSTPAVIIGKSAYQMKAVLADGRHVSGHFGKAAKRRRRG